MNNRTAILGVTCAMAFVLVFFIQSQSPKLIPKPNDDATVALRASASSFQYGDSPDAITYTNLVKNHRDDFHSQSGEEAVILHDFFTDSAEFVKTGGVVLEIGAVNGVLYSNSYVLENKLGWKAILIEGQPASAAELKVNRPKAATFAEAVCEDGQGTVKYMGGPTAVAGVVDTMAEGFKKMWHGDGTSPVIDVPCRPLASMIQDGFAHYGLPSDTTIDLFSLDVEGAELVVLATMDWNIRVRVWLIEVAPFDLEKNQALRDLLTEKGYVKSESNVRRLCSGGGPDNFWNRSGCMKNEVWVERSA